jgi:glutathione S-transferase
MLELWHNANSTCSQKVRLALAEKGLAWTGHVVDLRRFEQLSPGFLALNPAGMVPVLRHAGRVLTESREINEYLDDAFPQPALRPADAAGLARMRDWTRYIAEEPTWSIKAPSYQQNLRPVLAGTKSVAEFEAIAARMPHRENARRWVRAATDGFTPAELQADLERLAATLERMDAALAQGPWLAGEAMTLADVDMAPFVHRLAALGQARMIDTRPRVAQWYARMRARPAFAVAMAGTAGYP